MKPFSHTTWKIRLPDLNDNFFFILILTIDTYEVSHWIIWSSFNHIQQELYVCLSWPLSWYCQKLTHNETSIVSRTCWQVKNNPSLIDTEIMQLSRTFSCRSSVHALFLDWMVSRCLLLQPPRNTLINTLHSIHQ